MNEELESEMNKMYLTPENLADSEDESVDEAIPIQIRKERTIKSYKETMIQDIETIDKYENRIIVNITQLRPIYEVIDESYIKDSNIFPDGLSENLKSSNEPSQRLSLHDALPIWCYSYCSALKCLILAKADAKLLKQYLFNFF